MRVNASRTARTVQLLVLAAILGPFASTGHAQSVAFDWGGEKKPHDSGREVVSIQADAKVGEIIVGLTDRKLFLVVQPGVALSYPVAIPREQSKWQGRIAVTMKRTDPPWTPTPTMLAENPKLPRWVPGGHPMNPLGSRALYLGSSTYRIHGTDAPWTIGSAVSKGCIRMFNKDVQDLYPRVREGAQVTLTWNKVPSTPIKGNAEEAARIAAAYPTETPNGRARANTAQGPGSAPRAEQQAQAYAAPRSASKGNTPPGSGAGAETPALAVSAAAPSPAAYPRRPEPLPEAKAEISRVTAPITTGSLPHEPVRAAAEPARRANPTATAPSPMTIATKALEAAERAAAAAERAEQAAARAVTLIEKNQSRNTGDWQARD